MRSRTWLTSVSAAALVAGIIGLGPRIDTDIEYQAPDLPDDLESYLDVKESRFVDLKPGTEKKISWHHSDRRRTTLSVVYLHGFSATRQELSPLPERLAETLAANLYSTRLTGHGRSSEAMASGSLQAWIDDTMEAVAIGRTIGDRLLILGSSTGGSLAAWLAASGELNEQDVVVLLSPNFGLRRWDAALLSWPWAEFVLPWILGSHYSFSPWNEQHDHYWTTRYPVEALLPMAATVDLASAVDPGDNNVPVLILAVRKDKVVNTDKIAEYHENLSTSHRAIYWFETVEDPDRHVLAGDILSPQNTDDVEAKIVGFLRRWRVVD